MLFNCVAHGQPDSGDTGIYFDASGGGGTVIGCRLTSNHTGLKIDTGIRVGVGWLYFGSNTTDITGTYDILGYNGDTSHVELAGSETTDGYVDGTSDFNLDPDKAAQYNVEVTLP
jgi:hypothetical protein